MHQQHLFHFGGCYLLPSAIDDVLDAAGNKQISVLVQVSDVPGAKPAVPKCGFGSRDIIVIPPCDGRASQHDLSTLARGQSTALIVRDRNLGPGGFSD